MTSILPYFVQPYSQWTKRYRYTYHTTGFNLTYCSKTKYCMWQSVAQVTAGCNKQNVVFNNGLLELQPAVMLQFCNITAGCYLNHWLLHTIFCLLSACWIKTNGMIYIPIMFCPLTVYARRNSRSKSVPPIWVFFAQTPFWFDIFFICNDFCSQKPTLQSRLSGTQ